jgi:hypothetical protein
MNDKKNDKLIIHLKLITLILVINIFDILKLNGQTWNSVDMGTNADVRALDVYNNTLYAGGRFSNAGIVQSDLIAKYDGTSWSILAPDTFSGGVVFALVNYNSELYISGGFAHINGINALDIATWDGSVCNPFGSGVGLNDPPFCICEFNGDLFIGGTHGVSKWNGTSWNLLGGIVYDSPVFALESFNGNLYAGGTDHPLLAGVPGSYIAKYNGTSWSALGLGLNDEVLALGIYNNELYAGGYFTLSGTDSVNHLAKWNGTNWSSVSHGVNYSVWCLKAFDSALYIGGGFTMADSISASHVVKWNGSSFEALGTGMDSTVYALEVYDSSLYAGGAFINAGGITCNHIAKYSLLTNIDDVALNNIKIYPTVFSDKIVISGAALNHVTLLMTDAEGREVMKSSLNLKGNDEIQMPPCASGAYVLNIISEKGIIRKKLMRLN